MAYYTFSESPDLVERREKIFLKLVNFWQCYCQKTILGCGRHALKTFSVINHSKVGRFQKEKFLGVLLSEGFQKMYNMP